MRTKLACLLLASASLSALPSQVAAQAVTYGEPFQIPVFEQVDQNGVDLLSGMLRLTSPTIVRGKDTEPYVVGLQWTGQGWTRMDTPTIWRDGSKYVVNYRGTSEEFGDRSTNYVQKRPRNGSTLSCSIYEPGNLASECTYINRYGDVVHFKGRYSNITPYPGNFGSSSIAWGNIGMVEAKVFSEDNRDRTFGFAYPGDPSHDYNYYAQITYVSYAFNNSSAENWLTMTTPNHDTDSTKHYLRPRGVTQMITDPSGSVWRYTINSDREMTRLDHPGGGGDVTFTYDGNHRVTSVRNPAGLWTYSYSSSGDYGTTTVRSPLNEVTTVNYHRDKQQIRELRDPLGRVTTYAWDPGERLSRIIYPEQNYVAFGYDDRGNPVSQTLGPKPGGGLPITQTAGYDTTCTDRITCNRPKWTADGRGNRTDYEYEPSRTRQIDLWANQKLTIQTGTGKPIRITSPATSSGVRPEVRNQYGRGSGSLYRSSTCMTLASCIGTEDEVVTQYSYGSSSPLTVYEVAVTSKGQTLRTCYGYDSNGNRISETPPNAAVTACPKVTTAAPTAAAIPPVSGSPAVAPTFPDGTGGPTNPDPDPPCGWGTGVICP